MATNTLDKTTPKQSGETSMSVQELRRLYADAPPLAKTALENLLRGELARLASAAPAPVQTAGRIGKRQGKVSELTAILPLTKEGAKRLRGLLGFMRGHFEGADLVGTLHDMRFLLVDNDTKLLFATTYDGDWDPYIGDFATKIPDAMDVIFSAIDGWPGIHSPTVKDWLAKFQIPADAWYVASPNLTVVETRRLEKLGKAVDEFLDTLND